MDDFVTTVTISIHAPTRGATMVNEKGNCYKVFQSTLLQEERHKECGAMSYVDFISIHAPTRGATHVCRSR